MTGAPALPVSRADVDAAAERLAPFVRRTPVLALGDDDPLLPGGVLKLEMLQHTGTFKYRGMTNRLLSCEPGEAGVVVASGGNAGVAVAHAARRLGVRAEVFVPETAPVAKVARLRAYGAVVVQTGASYADAFAASAVRATETGAVVVHAYDQPEVVAGHGTLARELDEQAPGLDTVLVAVGGGGLVAGIACWFAGRVRVVAVETEGCPTLHAALAAGRPVDVAVGGVAADALGATRVGELCWAARAALAASVLVPDEAVLAARRDLWDQARLVTEPAGVAALAALRCGAYRPAPGERVAVVLCGANTDPATLAEPAMLGGPAPVG